MWLIKWVEMDNCLNYHPMYELAETYNEAREIKSRIEEQFDSQENKPNKVVSDPILVEVNFDDPNVRAFRVEELLFCEKCKEPAKNVIARIPLEVELVWNDAEAIYEIADDSYNLDDAFSVLCSDCLSDLLKQKE